MDKKDIKVGQIYKIKAGNEGRCYNFVNRKGKYIRIISISIKGSLRYDILNSDKNKVSNCYVCFKPEHLEPLSTKTKPAKPDKFIVIYDEPDRDPIRFFPTEKQARKFIKELPEDATNIRMIEIKREWRVGTTKSLKLVK